jgi:hypothetical protein
MNASASGLFNTPLKNIERPVLYYPYVHIRSEHWLKATLLCVPAVKRIVPHDYTPEDDEKILKYTEIKGPAGPLLQGVPSASAASFGAQELLLGKLREHADAIQGRFARPNAPTVDEYWIHIAKFNDYLLDYLIEHQLAWPSHHSLAYGNRSWYALHPVLGSAVMTILGLSIAREQEYDIVTESGAFHEALLASSEEAVIDALLENKSPAVQANQIEYDLSQLVITAAVNFQALQPEDIPELHASKRFRTFQHLIRAAAERVYPTDEEAYNKQLKQQAEEIIEAWQSAQREISARLRELFFQGLALSARAFKLAKGGDFNDVASIGPTAVGFVRNVRALFDYARHRGPYHFLTEVRNAEQDFLRMTFPLGLER